VQASRWQIPAIWSGQDFDLTRPWTGVVSIPQIESYDLNGVSQNPIGEVNDDLSLGIHTDMPHLPAAVSDEAGAGPQLDGLSNRFNSFRLADLAGRHLGMDTHDQKREKSTDSSIA